MHDMDYSTAASHDGFLATIAIFIITSTALLAALDAQCQNLLKPTTFVAVRGPESATPSWPWFVASMFAAYLVGLWLAAAFLTWLFSGALLPRGGWVKALILTNLLFGVLFCYSAEWYASGLESFLKHSSSSLSVAFLLVPSWSGLSADGVYAAYHAACNEMNGRSSTVCSARYAWHYLGALPRNVMWARHLRLEYSADFLRSLRRSSKAMLLLTACYQVLERIM